MEGRCGSPVLTDDGDVVGLFRLMTNSGKAYYVSAEVLDGDGIEVKQQW